MPGNRMAIRWRRTPLRLRSNVGVLSLFSTTTVFGTPIDVTLAELAIEAFFPADDETAEKLRELNAQPRASEN